jgi:hypothetical protein
MDISDQIGSKFIKVVDLVNGPQRTVIHDVRPGSFEKPNAEFRNGSILSLNATNMRALASAWGTETDTWIGKEVELYIGETRFNNEARQSVLVRPISPATPMSERPKPKPPSERPRPRDFDDSIPFAWLIIAGSGAVHFIASFCQSLA